jgi:lysophospholipase L1-like esterase
MATARTHAGATLVLALVGLGLTAYALAWRDPDPFLVRGLGLRSIALAALGEALFLAALGRAWRRLGRVPRGPLAGAAALASLVAQGIMLRHPLSGAFEFPHRAAELQATQGLLLLALALFAVLWAWPAFAAAAASRHQPGGLLAQAWQQARGPAANLALSLIAIAATIGAGESALRLVEGPPRHPVTIDPVSGGSVNRYDSVLGWVLADDQNPTPDGSFVTGAHGLRMNGRTIAAPPPDAILAVGDSFTAGSGVTNWNTWPAQLEALLGEPVLNGATGGWGADQIVLRAESLIDALAPRTVIVSFLADDIMRTRYAVFGGGHKPWFTVEDGALVPHNVPVPPLAERTAVRERWWHRLLGASYFAVAVMHATGTYDRWLGNNTPVLTDVAGVSCRMLERLKARADDEGVALMFVLQYDGDLVAKADAEPVYARRVVDCAERAGIPTLNTWERLRAIQRRSPAELESLYDMTEQRGRYGHMTPAGNRVIAELIAETLRARR